MARPSAGSGNPANSVAMVKAAASSRDPFVIDDCL
jgi:hypothetical protein